MQQGRAAERIAAQRAHMQSFVDRFRAKATKARQAQARIKALEKLPVIDTVVEAAPTRFDFPEPARLSPPILVMDRVSAGYGTTRVLSGVSLSVDMDDRIAMLGYHMPAPGIGFVEADGEGFRWVPMSYQFM